MATPRKKNPQKGGRPSLYRKNYAEQGHKLCLLGYTDAKLAEFFGVTESTLYKWKNEHPEFSEGLRAGKVVADAEVVSALRQRALGYSHKAQKIMQYEGRPVVVDYIEHYPPDTPAAIFYLINRQPEYWKAKREGGIDDEDAPPPVRVVVEVKDARKPENNAESEPSAS